MFLLRKSIGRIGLLLAMGAIASCTDGAGQSGASARDERGNGPTTLVTTAKIETAALADRIEAVGTALANESVDITAKVADTVARIDFAEGQQVPRGKLLAVLDSAEAAASARAAESALAEARRQHQRSRDLAASNALSRAQLDQIETALAAATANFGVAQARLANHFIRAPFAGRAGLRRVSVGSLVAPGTIITTLDDVSTIKLEFTVPEAQLYLLAPGRAVEATTVGLPDRVFKGTIGEIDSRIDPSSRALRVRAHLPNKEGLLRPGMFMAVSLQGPEVRALVVPEAAIVPEQGRTFVFVVKPDHTVSRREVRVGRRRAGIAEIAGGAQLGETVVTDGTLSLREGAAIRVAGGADHASR